MTTFGFLHRAHPFTGLSLAFSLAVLAFLAPGPSAAGLTLAAALGLALAARVARDVAGPAAALVLPFWLLLFVLHALMGGGESASVGPLQLSVSGLARASVLGARVATVLVAFLTVMSAIHPARLMEALGEKGVSFRVSYLFAASLNAVPRMRERARGILEAQRARGLAVGGGLLGRLRAVAPLVLPLVLGSLAEVEERALALEARAARSETRRTVLDPPRDSLSERVTRWGLAVLLVGLGGWRILG